MNGRRYILWMYSEKGGKRGKAAATAERTKVLAAKAEALYIKYVSTK